MALRWFLKDLNSLPVTEEEVYSNFTISLLVIKQIRLFFERISWFVKDSRDFWTQSYPIVWPILI